MERQVEHRVMQPPPSWVLIVRPILILGCFVAGFSLFNRIVIRGSILDGKTTPAWSKDGINLYKAREAMYSADFAEAESTLLQLIKKQPKFGEAHCMLGRLYLQQDRFDEAMRHYRIAHEYLPGEEEPADALAQLETAMNQRTAVQVQSDSAPSD